MLHILFVRQIDLGLHFLLQIHEIENLQRYILLSLDSLETIYSFLAVVFSRKSPRAVFAVANARIKHVCETLCS